MSGLFENAVISIQLGVEDYQANDARRAISAVRNFYAGVLLLAKETLVRTVPEANADELLAAKYKPVPDGNGGVEFIQDGGTTIDFVTIGRRFKDFGLMIDRDALESLNRIRNDIEHFYTDKPKEAVREAVARAFPVVVQLFRQIGEKPREHLGATWEIMLATRALYEAELAGCRGTFAKVKWRSGTIGGKGLACSSCGSALVRQEDAANADQARMNLNCRACGEDLEVGDAIEATLAKVLAGESFIRAKDAGEDGPIFSCTECGKDTYIDFEEGCANCGHQYEDVECARCGNLLSMDEIIHGDSTELCSYCSNMMEKIMRE
jgi:hypothetical protein